MENITIDKSSLVAAYKAGNEEQKQMLEQLCGKDVLESKWRDITSYEKACEVLGIRACELMEIGDRPQYMRMANAMQQLIVICEAINGDGGWYDSGGYGYFPVFISYTKKEMQKYGEAECKRRGIHQLLSAYYANSAEHAGVCYGYTHYRSALTDAIYGFPLCLNSEEKAAYVGEQFFELCCTCYGLTPKMG